jgi:hypothetical protein
MLNSGKAIRMPMMIKTAGFITFLKAGLFFTAASSASFISPPKQYGERANEQVQIFEIASIYNQNKNLDNIGWKKRKHTPMLHLQGIDKKIQCVSQATEL